MATLVLSLLLSLPAQERSWQTALVDGSPKLVWGWKGSDNRVLWFPHEQPPNPPQAPPEDDGLGSPDRLQGEPSGLPAYATNGVLDARPTERVIYTNVPSLAPSLAREYGVEVRTDGEPPKEYPHEEHGNEVVLERFVAPICILASVLLIFGIKLRQP